MIFDFRRRPEMMDQARMAAAMLKQTRLRWIS